MEPSRLIGPHAQTGCDVAGFDQSLLDAAVVSVCTSIPFGETMADAMARPKIPMANVLGPSACVQWNAVLNADNVILAYCHIGACAVAGDGVFFSPYLDVEHHAVVGEYCSFGPG